MCRKRSQTRSLTLTGSVQIVIPRNIQRTALYIWGMDNTANATTTGWSFTKFNENPAMFDGIIQGVSSDVIILTHDQFGDDMQGELRVIGTVDCVFSVTEITTDHVVKTADSPEAVAKWK